MSTRRGEEALRPAERGARGRVGGGANGAARWWRPASLHGRLALGALLSTSVSLLVFALAAFVVVVADEQSEATTMTVAQVDWEAGREVLAAMAAALPLSLLIAAGGSYWLSRRVLAPLDQVVRVAREVTAQDLARRLPVPANDDELRALVLAQNALFARLEQGFKGLSRFASDASHELRTPLAVIGNELEVALRRPRTPEEWRGAAERSLDELQRLHRLVEALIEMARADAESPLSESRVGLHGLVAEVVAGLAPVAEARGMELRGPARASADGDDHDGRGHDGELWVRGSREGLRVALANLLSNGLRYSPDGGRVAVSVEPCHAGGAAIHVDDSGKGVDPDEAEAIFTPFARGARGREADQLQGDGRRGLGLGLSMARRIVERHGGSVRAAASAGPGARFTIELPLLAGERA